MSEGQNGYGKFFQQARQASGRSSASGTGSGTAKEKSRRQFTMKPERAAQSGSKRTQNQRGDSSSVSTRETDIEEIIRRATPEENLRAELGKKIQARSKVARKKKNSFPVGACLFLVLVILGAASGYYRPEIFENLAAHIEIGFLGQARAADESPDKSPDKSTDVKAKSAKGLGKSVKDKSSKKEDAAKSESAALKDGVKVAAAGEAVGEKTADGDDEKKDEKVTSIHGWTPEELSFFNKLNDRKKQLDLREAELNKLEEELQKQKLALDDKIKQLDHTRDEISATLKTRVATDQAKIDKLVEFYSTMKPQQAAKVIESLNEDLAVNVLDKMKKKNAAEVLNVMDAKKARRFSELLTGYERSPASPEANAEAGADQAQAAK